MCVVLAVAIFFFCHLPVCRNNIGRNNNEGKYGVVNFFIFFTNIINFFLRTLKVIGIMDADGQKLDGTARYLGGLEP